MLIVCVFKVAVIPAQCVGPAPLPMDVCVLEAAKVVYPCAAPAPACSVVLSTKDFVTLDLSMTTAV